MSPLRLATLAFAAHASCGASLAPPPLATPAPLPTLRASAEPTSPPPPAPEAPPPPPVVLTTPTATAPRLTSQAAVTWIYGRPKVDTRYIGYIRTGTSVALSSTERVRGEGCSSGFYRVEPRGFVCNDRTVTLVPSPRFLEMSAAAAAAPGPLPYRYAFSDGTPMYNRVPTPAEQRRREGGLGPAGDARRPKAKKLRSSYEDLASLDAIAPSDPMPPFLANGGMAAEDRQGLVNEPIPAASMLSFTKAFTAEGRTFLLSADQNVVPADRVRLFHPSTFHGTRLGSDVKLPLAWIRTTSKPQHHRLASGELDATGGTWAVRTFVALTGASVEQGAVRYLETRDHDGDGTPLYIAEKDATVVEPAARLGNAVKPDQKWIVVSITRGTLVAYEGLTPVYTTLVSPGRGGVPIAGRDNVDASTTPLGTYNITFKDRAATMSPDKPGAPRTQWISDVPYTQYFNSPFALHTAYWHERFGDPTSAGCINLAPLDAEALFQWSDPQVPDDWQGATGAGAPENGPTTAVVVKR